ncbi:MAG: YigZ family protein [Candidatus Zixiibacteriota bacterium]
MGMLVVDEYTTIDHADRAEIKVKGSRFIAEAFQVVSEEETLTRLESVRKREFQATHHCYAYVLGAPVASQFKYSDDGEPSGTAGKPIYDLIIGRSLTNVLVVVTRYFGGTRLGTGGLARAYSDAARAVLDRSGTRINYMTCRFRCEIEFSFYDSWQRELRRLGAYTVDARFSDRVTLVIDVRRSGAAELAESLAELTSGKGLLEEIDA